METRSIEIVKNTICGGVRVRIGEIVENASKKDAAFLINTKRAVPYDGEPPKRGRKKAPENRMISGEELENRGIE